MAVSDPSSALYPKFISYQNKYFLPNLFKGIQYVGGLSMHGSRLVGTGNVYEPARLEIYEKDTLRMVIRSSQINILKNGITSQSVRMTMFLETDSITHPDLIFNYQERSDLFRLTKSDTYTSELLTRIPTIRYS
jgi:hypothetical protein